MVQVQKNTQQKFLPVNLTIPKYNTQLGEVSEDYLAKVPQKKNFIEISVTPVNNTQEKNSNIISAHNIVDNLLTLAPAVQKVSKNRVH